MDNHGRWEGRYCAIGWGSALIMLGILNLIPGDQTGLALAGIGLILLGFNALRAAKGLPVAAFSTVLGAAALLTGALVLMRSRLGLNFEVDLFPILLIAVGAYLLWPQRNGGDRRST